MKKMKRIVSVVLALVMMMAMSMTAFAAETTETVPTPEGGFTITVKQNVDDKTEHTYEAYQIFKGDLALQTVTDDEGNETSEKVLSNIEWGSGVNGGALLAALKANGTLGALFADCETAADVADVLGDPTKFESSTISESTLTDEFAKVVGANLSTTVAGTKAGTGNVEITVPEPGYYMVKDKDGTVSDKGGAYSRLMLQVVGNAEATVKSTIPDIDKKIVSGPNDTDRVDANNAGIGEVVSYEITGSVPNRTGYNNYFYVISDTLSKGLTFNNDIKVSIGETVLTVDDDYAVRMSENEDGTTTFEISLTDIMNKDYAEGDKITVTYSATVNADAEIGVNSNDNDVYLKYSNNPNKEYSGEDFPNDDDPMGEGPNHKTRTYVTQLNIKKKDGNGNPLAGAEFTLTGTSYQTVLTEGEYFVQNDEGSYWLLTDGTYTTEDPETVGMNTSKYVSTVVKYEKIKATSTEVIETKVKMIATSDEEGNLTFKGLGAGKYTIEETVVPAGYNKADDVEVEIKFTAPTTANGDPTWEAETSKDDEGVPTVTVNTGIYNTTIVNLSGSVLPSTGGIGTTIFYVVGGILVVGAAILLVTKKRMSKAE